MIEWSAATLKVFVILLLYNDWTNHCYGKILGSSISKKKALAIKEENSNKNFGWSWQEVTLEEIELS